MSRFDFFGFVGVVVGLLVGMVGHELAHAWSAVKLGDPTPRMMGRLTLNPKAHADPVGTLILPGIFAISVLFEAPSLFLFGYAKPVTIHPNRLRNPKRDTILVALAGPVFNLFVVAVIALIFRASASTLGDRVIAAGTDNWRRALYFAAVVNTFLFIINILPIPPLDGSKILARFLPPAAQVKMEEWSQYLFLFIIVLFLIFRGVLQNVAAAIYEPLMGLPRF